MDNVQVDRAAIRAFLEGPEIRADLHRRARRVVDAAARRAAEVSPGWAASMDSEAGTDALGPYEDVSWRETHGKGTGGGWRGHFFEFGHDEVPAHPALRPALDAAVQD